MKRRTNNKNLPKVTLISKKDGERQYLYPSIRKTRYFLLNKAKVLLKNDYKITIRVIYSDGLENTGEYDNLTDLKLAFKAFITEYLD